MAKAKLQTFAVDYSVSGDPVMHSAECVIDNESTFAKDEDFAKIIADRNGLHYSYIGVYHFVLLNEMRPSHHRRL